MNDIQTILIETNEQTRVALRVALRSQPGIEVASEATNGTTGLVLLESIDVDVAIVDADLPDMSIAEFTQQMRERQVDSGITISKLLILLDLGDPQRLLDAWAVRAEGYCRKNASVEEMAEAIRHIYAGSKYIDSAIAQRLPINTEQLNPNGIHLQFNQIQFNQMGAFI
ncbi:response regulator transcription factor [Pseudanabaena sp. PCC 6802]|uniref:response regulator n=1 Tax=Pseudanabaena sp. PCC 6802 TaxID=118173 RepID=UPI0003488504|nr:response regulator transcription factor [Pseudanabaena sp. PCC 6802]